MHGLSVGNEVLKQLHQEMSLDKVEKLMDQTREGVEYQRVSLPVSPHQPMLIIRKSTRHYNLA